MTEYIILTASAAEGRLLEQLRWIPAANLVPVTRLAGLRGRRVDVFYTDGALDALVRSAAVDGRAWDDWRELRRGVLSVRPFEAWEYLHETSQEELIERGRGRLAVLSSVTHVSAAQRSLSVIDLINFERRHCAADVRTRAADHLVRIAPGRVLVTESQYGGVVEIRATWTALAAAARKAPEWLVSGLDTESTSGVR